jgi:hypothetical protein
MTEQTQEKRQPRLSTNRLCGALLLATLSGTSAGPALAAEPAATEKKATDCAADVRYCDNGDGTVRDTKTGLLWLKDASCLELGPTHDGRGTFDEAKAAAAALKSGQCGLSDGSKAGDWRLPTSQEWQATLNPQFKNPALSNGDGTRKWRPGDVFINVRSDGYWSSTADSKASDFAWGAGLFAGVVASARKGIDGYIWPVRTP